MVRMDPIELIENLRTEVKRGKRECQNETLALFKKIFIAIGTNTDTASVNMGLDNLTNEVNDLKTKLTAVTRERDNLLDTVDNMKMVMEQLSAKMMTTMQPLPIVNDSQNIPEIRSFDNGNESRGSGAQEKENHEDPEEASDENIQQPVQNYLNASCNSNDYDFNTEVDVDIKENVTAANEEVKEDPFPTRKYIPHGEHLNLDHSQDASKGAILQLQMISTKTGGGKQLQCNQCSYFTTTKNSHHMKNHVASVHLKLKNYRCKDCGFAAARKNQVDRHYDAIHNKGYKKFRCGRCPYSSAQRPRLNEHIARVHEMGSASPAQEVV